MQAQGETSTAVVVARIGAVGALVLGTAAVLRPFWTPIAWAAILAYLTWPLFVRLRARSKRPRLAAALFTAAVALGLGFPLAVLLVTLADEATTLVRTLRDWLAQGSPLPDFLAPLWERAESFLFPAGADGPTGSSPVEAPRLGDWVGQVGSRVSRPLVQVAGGIGRNALRFGFTMVTLYGFYLTGERMLATARSLAPVLLPTAPERFLERIGRSVQAVVFGLLGTAMVQGLLAGVGLAVAGVPSPVALGAATSFLSLLPGGGGAVTLTAAAWLAFDGRWIAGIALALWSLLVVSSVDNVLRPVLISERGRIPFLLVFFGVIGGLSAFGLIGLFLGPVLLSVSFTLLSEFVRAREEAARPEQAEA